MTGKLLTLLNVLICKLDNISSLSSSKQRHKMKCFRKDWVMYREITFIKEPLTVHPQGLEHFEKRQRLNLKPSGQ